MSWEFFTEPLPSDQPYPSKAQAMELMRACAERLSARFGYVLDEASMSLLEATGLATVMLPLRDEHGAVLKYPLSFILNGISVWFDEPAAASGGFYEFPNPTNAFIEALAAEGISEDSFWEADLGITGFNQLIPDPGDLGPRAADVRKWWNVVYRTVKGMRYIFTNDTDEILSERRLGSGDTWAEAVSDFSSNSWEGPSSPTASITGSYNTGFFNLVSNRLTRRITFIPENVEDIASLKNVTRLFIIFTGTMTNTSSYNFILKFKDSETTMPVSEGDNFVFLFASAVDFSAPDAGSLRISPDDSHDAVAAIEPPSVGPPAFTGANCSTVRLLIQPGFTYLD